MKPLTIPLLMIALASPMSAQQLAASTHADAGAAPSGEGSNLPVERIGPDDLLGITVYDSPELTRTFRVDSGGDIRLPMVKRRIQSTGLYPAELEAAIASVLIEENVLVDPVVTVSVVEYRSRPITVSGAVRTPMTFQATGTVTLLDAIARAGGITETAGPEILVSHQPSSASDHSTVLTERIMVRSLLGVEDPTFNLMLQGGENIRVPEAGRFFVAGNVKKPGIYPIADGLESSIIRALALSEGLDSFSGRIAYIYRIDGGSGRRIEIPVEVKKILARKSPDVPLYANDMLYVPNSSGLRASAKVIEVALGAGLGLAGILVLATR